MDELTHHEWTRVTREAVSAAILGCFARRLSGTWHENAITEAVLQAVGTSRSLHWAGRPFRCTWKAFKASGRFETANGDIAMKVSLHTGSGGVLTGTKCFEAKKRGLQTGQYDAFDRAQLGRMQHLPGHEVLLYALHLPSSGGDPFSEAMCLPTPVAAMLFGSPAAELHRAAQSFTDVLTLALLGRGLNFDPRHAEAFDASFAALNAVPSFAIEASIAPLALDLAPPQAPPGYEELAENEPESFDDLSPSP
ncbi:hypothetical protein P5Y53_04920 [Dyella jiangningensis]|jgi:hypothetical protein|uniref:hypothetical protein n=1 Tax=Dyella jiangningensis TaxID=1379159 RepID=UPI002410332E|nr:hypothetical protein [Dyella jiangningensis]MDG2536997.1 hypothetical protein [Dyella jiangningensis]